MQAAFFFDAVRSSLFGGKLTQAQVNGINAILDAWGRHGDLDRRHLAYILATAYHETGATMQPIRERGTGDGPDADPWDDYLEKYDTGKLAADLGNTPEADGDGVRFAGRGFVQLTGQANYLRAGQKLGLDLINSPDLALDMKVSASIIVLGMLHGWFTGKKLSDYDTFLSMRRVVNGTDRAQMIAGYAEKFLEAIPVKTAAQNPKPTPSPSPTTPKRKTLMDVVRGWFVKRATTHIVSQVSTHIKDNPSMFSFLDGYKTYIATGLLILVAVAQMIGIDTPVVPEGGEVQTIWAAVIALFMRQGIAKS